MNPELNPTLLAELRDLHQSERAPAELEQSVLARLLPSQSKASLGARVRARWSRAPWGSRVLGATLGMAAVGAVYLGGQALSVQASGVLGPEPRLDAAGEARKAAARCPLDDLPPGFVYEPTRVEPEAASAGLHLDAFAMPMQGCPALVRRALSYVPSGLIRGPSPVLIVLHDGGDSAEGVRTRQTQGSFEALAESHGIILVYANAAPAAGRVPNSGVWQTDPGANRAIDDHAYLARIVERLIERGLVAPGGIAPGKSLDVFLVGYGSGAQLALDAAARDPGRYTGVAALLPDRVNRLRPEPRREGARALAVRARRLERVLFVALEPGAHGPGARLDEAVLDDWKAAVGLARGQAAPLLGPALDEASLLARGLVPAGTKIFDTSFPDKGGPAMRVLAVQSEAALDVGPGGSPAPVDAATVVWEFFQRGVPGFFDRGRSGYPGGAGP